jgi:hypothetical protein
LPISAQRAALIRHDAPDVVNAQRLRYQRTGQWKRLCRGYFARDIGLGNGALLDSIRLPRFPIQDEEIARF